MSPSGKEPPLSGIEAKAIRETADAVQRLHSDLVALHAKLTAQGRKKASKRKRPHPAWVPPAGK